MKFADKVNMVLCDDIREEKGNKFSLMGIYASSIVVDRTPVILPKLCLFVMLIGTKKNVPNMNIVFKSPNAAPMNQLLEVPTDQAVGGNVATAMAISPFKVNSPGDAQFEIRFEGEKRPSLIYKFKILTTASPDRD